ncbi:hypothetical protein [Pandoraea sp. ISTKB]|uniref:hypothetical protein n=1 Tax=Pandoraea sp. ISTKB TaxID=1586708 RepID=UPI00084667BC|nr:hypothetical protein [Pandoraea sp. ISTKB]ODP33070.1 hypothetical protein A9762_20720 [Pandoraea sp. ISTKB]
MTKLQEPTDWSDEIYQLETSDQVLGGPDGIDNVQAKQLAGRTNWLRDAVAKNADSFAAHEEAVDPHKQYATKRSLDERIAALVPATAGIDSNTAIPASASGTLYEISDGTATLPAPADRLIFEFWGTGVAKGKIAAPGNATLQLPDGTITPGGVFPVGANTAVRVRCDGASWLITNLSGVVRAKSGAITADWGVGGKLTVGDDARVGGSVAVGGDGHVDGTLVVVGSATVGSPSKFGDAAQFGQLGNCREVVGTTDATVLTANQAGSSVNVGGATAYTNKLPLSSSCRSGSTFEFLSSNGVAVTIACQGTDKIAFSGMSASSIALLPGDNLTLRTNGTGIWFAFGGAAQLQYSSALGGSLGTNWYQKYPNGKIENRGSGVTDANGILVQTLPLAYPGAARGGVAILYGGGGSTLVTVPSQTLSQITIATKASSTGVAQPSQPVAWISWGE